MAMTYLEILGWARKGLQADKEKHREMQEKALEGQALDIAGHCQEVIDTLDVKLATLDEIEDLHNRKCGAAWRTSLGHQKMLRS